MSLENGLAKEKPSNKLKVKGKFNKNKGTVYHITEI